MSEKTSLKHTALLSAYPIFILLFLESYLFVLQGDLGISTFALAMFAAQLLCSVVFLKGQICPGQRGRLAFSQAFFALFWLVSLIFVSLSAENQVVQWIISLCGLAMIGLSIKQPRENDQLRNQLLSAALLLGLVGAGIYLASIAQLFRAPVGLVYNPFAQLLVGVILANFALLTSRNRLQGFIALLPFAMAILLVLNMISALIWLYAQPELANYFALILYFALHLVAMAILLALIFSRQKLSHFHLTLLLLCSASMPLWAAFANLV